MTDYSVATKIANCEKQLERIADALDVIAKRVEGFDPVYLSALFGLDNAQD
jgi:hypothetical protein